MTLHSSTYKGKKILIILKDGTKLIGRFEDKKSGAIFTKEHGRIPTSKVKAMTICKASAYEKFVEETEKKE